MHDRTRMNIRKIIAPLSHREKREALAELLRSNHPNWRGYAVTAADKLDAIEIDNELAGHGSRAKAQRALAKFLAKCNPSDAAKIEALFRKGA